MAIGETTRWNIEQQVIDPDPEYAGNIMEGGPGDRGAAGAPYQASGQGRQPCAVGRNAAPPRRREGRNR